MQIKGKKYPKPDINRFKRSQVKALKPAMAKLHAEDFEALWDIIHILFPDLPDDVLDDLDVSECKSIVERAGVAKFTDDDSGEITVGESSASTSS